MININDWRKDYFNKRNDIDEIQFYEFGAHFKYKDLYNKLLQIINEKKRNKTKETSKTIIKNNSEKKKINKGISRNQMINNNDIQDNDSFIFSLKNISKNKLNDFSHKNNKIQLKKNTIKNHINIQKNNVLKIFKKKIINNENNIIKRNNINIDSKSFSQTRNINSIGKNQKKILLKENDLKFQFSNYFNQNSKFLKEKSITKKLSPNRNNSKKFNTNIINKISRNQNENKKELIENNKSISNNISQQSSASTEKNTNKTSHFLDKNQKIIHLKKKYDNHNLFYKQNAETLPNQESYVYKNKKDNYLFTILVNKKIKKRNNVSASKCEKNIILKHSIFQTNRINSIYNKINYSNSKKEKKEF